jgi:ABC-type antimicrobial peptide transport system permease subunit
MILLFAGGALFVLALACVNFTNLSTAAAAARAREIGIRKTVGARRSDIVRQFLGESIGTSFLALGAALVLLALVLPAFNRVAGKELTFAAVLKPSTILGFLAITVLAGIAAGIYPAFALSSFQARAVLAGRAAGGLSHSAGLRKGLVVFQFALSLVLVVGTAVVGRQIAFIKAKDLGFDRRNLVVFRLGQALSQGYEGFKTELLRNPGIVGVTSGFQNPVNISSTVFGGAVDWPGKDPAMKVTLNWDYVDYDYFETLKATFGAGRPFSREFPSDIQGAFVINEAAARLMGFPDPVGQKMTVFRNEGTIVGIVRDFHFRPLRHAIRPIVYRLRPSARSWAVVRIAPGTAAASLRTIGEIAKRIDPDTLFESVFFDDLMIRSQYFIEQKIWTVANYLTMTAVFIACIGLFGLALFMTQQRTKEIGVRKVMGASAAGLAAKLARDFLVWVGVAIVLACPLAYWVSAKILGMYAYRTSVGAGLFFLAGLAMLAVATLTVGVHTLRAVRANPVDSLRCE